MGVIEEALEKIRAIADKGIWGVDSFDPSTIPVPGEGGITLYEYVVKKSGSRPDFFGRYLTHFTAAATIKDEEAQFLAKNDCKVLLFHAAITAGDVSKDKTQGFESGQRHANAAMDAADKLSVPSSVHIYANIEPEWNPTAEWMLGWWGTCFKRRHAENSGGFYCGPRAFPVLSKAFDLAPDRITADAYSRPPVLWLTQGSGGTAPTLSAMPGPVGRTSLVKGWQYSFHHGKKNFEWDSNIATSEGFDRMWAPQAKQTNARHILEKR